MQRKPMGDVETESKDACPFNEASGKSVQALHSQGTDSTEQRIENSLLSFSTEFFSFFLLPKLEAAGLKDLDHS